MKKNLTRLSFCASLTLLMLCLTGCITDLFYGSIISIDAEGGDGAAIISWEDVNYFNSRIGVGFQNLNDESDSFETVLSGDPGYARFCDLQNGETYKVYAKIVTSAGKVKSSKETTVTPSADFQRQKITYNSATGENSFIKLDRDNFAVTINNVKGKDITYAIYNKNESQALSYASTRKLAYSPVNVSTANSNQQSNSNNISRSAASDVEQPELRHFNPPAIEKTKVSEVVSRAAETEDPLITETFNKENPQVGQTKDIYVDTDLTNVAFTKERMTLYAICYVPGTTKVKALIWANPDSVVQTGSSETKISIPAIQSLAQKYIQYYQMEENIFGETRDFIVGLDSTGKNMVWTDIASYPTKDYINIVLTDIEKDYGKGKNSIVGGYFWSKDYYAQTLADKVGKVCKYSNEGKYFYIDIPWCNRNASGEYTGNNDKVSDSAISTLFHEYQHMIHYNTKINVQNSNDAAHWFNEMMSMLCEDLLQDAMDLEETVQMGRIKDFNIAYNYSGIAHYRNDEYSFLSYGTSYAFGSWVARNYGGAALVGKMSKNDKLGLESVVAAVSELNTTLKSGKPVTQQNLIEEYLQAVGFRNAYAAKHNLPTHNVVPSNTGAKVDITIPDAKVTMAQNKDGSSPKSITVSGNTYTAKLASGINLWSKTYKYDVDDGSNKYSIYGPVLMNQDTEIDVNQTGFLFYPVTVNTSVDNVTLYFSKSYNDDEEIYIFIQDSVNSENYSMFYEDKTPEVQN